MYYSQTRCYIFPGFETLYLSFLSPVHYTRISLSMFFSPSLTRFDLSWKLRDFQGLPFNVVLIPLLTIAISSQFKLFLLMGFGLHHFTLFVLVSSLLSHRPSFCIYNRYSRFRFYNWSFLLTQKSFIKSHSRHGKRESDWTRLRSYVQWIHWNSHLSATTHSTCVGDLHASTSSHDVMSCVTDNDVYTGDSLVHFTSYEDFPNVDIHVWILCSQIMLEDFFLEGNTIRVWGSQK